MTGRWLIVFLVVWGWQIPSHGQYLSAGGRFQVDQVRGCAPLTITVTPEPLFPCDNSNPCAAFWDWDNNKSLTEPLITPPFTHTYTQPGIYKLKILRSTVYDSIAIEVVPNIPPDFQVFTCANHEVAVTITDTNYDDYVINFNDGSPLVVAAPSSTTYYTYASSTTRTITVRGRKINAADNCSEAGVIVTPLASLPAPTITLLEVLDASTIRLEFNALPNVQYKLGIATNNATTFQQVKTIYNTTADTILNLKTDDNYYCFQLAAFDPCNNTVINSATICSANLDLSVRNKVIDVVWSTNTAGISNYELTRNASDGTLLITNPAGSPYADSGILCGTTYCYRLTSRYPNGSQSVSLSKCGTGFSTDTPSAIENITAMTGDNSVVLEWETDPNFIPAEFTLEKSVGGKYTVLSTTTQTAFSDSEYRVEDASCYRIRYTDVCGNESPLSIEACPIRLGGNLLADNSISLSWTPYEGWTNGVAEYTVEKYSEDGTLLQTYSAGSATTYVDATDDLDHQAFLYVVKAIAVEPGIGQSASNRIVILKDPNLFHPTAFTPNGDNLNDNFTVFGQYVVSFEMQIFNRWGELLFVTDDLQQGWDGTFRGREMPEGTYTFIAHITDRAGRTFKRSGSVLLLRKD